MHVNYRYAPHNDFSVNDGPHIRRWFHNIIFIAIYSAETWTLREVDQKHLGSFEMW
jgi:hypothetical protein